jgi:hypothetical protein
VHRKLEQLCCEIGLERDGGAAWSWRLYTRPRAVQSSSSSSQPHAGERTSLVVRQGTAGSGTDQLRKQTQIWLVSSAQG